MAFELRTFTLDELRVARNGDEPPRIQGHAAIFNTRSLPLWEWAGERVVEIVAPGAFAARLPGADVRALQNHDPNYVLGRKRANASGGTLTVEEDELGLRVEILPPETTWARDLLVSMERGDVDQMSFAFKTLRERWEHEVNEETGLITHVRTLLETSIDGGDVSVVTFPAYPDTDAQVRSLIEASAGAPESLRRALLHDTAGRQGPKPAGDEPGRRQGLLALLERELELIEHAIYGGIR